MNNTSERFSLNSEQRRAVEHREGPLLVVAGAGTGKTRVITERIRMLLEGDPSLSGENILALTYTDKAAGEMKYRVVKAAGDRAENLWVSTFHKFCLEKILQTADETEERNVQPLEDLDHRILLRRHIGELKLEIFKRLQEPGEFLGDFVQFFSRCQDELVTPDDYQRYAQEARRKFEAEKRTWEPDARAIAEEQVARTEELARVYRVSERLLRERKLLTFGEQIMHAAQRLRTDAALRERLQEQYRYVLVDEFQDTNIAQLELLWLLAGGHRNIMAVGDHNQAIYRFRGASYGSFTIFLKRFCGAGSQAASSQHLVTLSQNYRSTKRILNVAGAVILNNQQSQLLPPNLLRTENREGEKIRIGDFGTFHEEAHWVVSEIERLHSAGAPWRDFAVLYRRHTHRDQILNALRQKHIPFVIRRYSILTSTLVRDLMAWLRLIGVPADNVACARVLAAPYWGLEPRDLVRLAERADKNRRRPLCEGLESAANEPPFNRQGVRLPEMLQLLHALRQSARRKAATEVLDELITGLELAPLPSEADRAYLDRFVEFVTAWERKSEGKQLRDFIEYLYYFHEAKGDIYLEEVSADDAVQLMTVHSAKGLEFPYVFVMRLSRNDFPGGLRPPEFEFPPELMKEEKPEGDFHIEEERRLFYVALTRAERQLALTTVINKRKKQSAFIDDILTAPKIQKFDVTQVSPKVHVPPSEEIAGSEPDSLFSDQLFGPRPGAGRAYSRVALWAKAFHPPRPEPLQLSVSAISDYDGCPLKYQFKYMWSLRGGPHPQMTFGNVMHTTVKEYVKAVAERKKVPLEDVLGVYDREWSSAGFPDDYHEQEYRSAGREQLTAFYGTYSAAPAKMLFQEKSFELPLEPGIVITGRMDQVNDLGDGEVEIVDYKTGRPRDAKKAAADLQLSVYAIAAQEILDLEPTRLVLYNLMNNEAVATTRDAKALKATKQKIAEVADLIRGGEFAPKAGFGCGFCDYKPLCPAHEQLISISATLSKTRA